MILNYTDITIKQGLHTVLSDVSLSVEEGEMVYLTGAVGTGKSSLLKTIYAALPLQGTQAQVAGFDLLHLRTRQQPLLRRQLGIVFQDFQLLADRTVEANLDFVLRATDWKKADRTQRIQQVLEMVKLADRRGRFIYELSGGEQQRICIARAILNHPRLILADEPTGNLDAENGEMILALLDEIRRQHNTAVIMSTHNPAWPQYFPGTVYECANGKITKK